MGQSEVNVQPSPFTCLIADDSAFARRNIARVVSTVGGTVVAEAANGQDAVDLYRRLAPDLVLLDVTMPVLDGVDTLRMILEENGQARVIMVSAIGHREMVWKAICMGARHYVTKPFAPDYAGMIIQSVMNGGAS